MWCCCAAVGLLALSEVVMVTRSFRKLRLSAVGESNSCSGLQHY
jgi:hypothetical protein